MSPRGRDNAGVATPHQDLERRIEMLRAWLARRVSTEDLTWLAEQAKRIRTAADGSVLTSTIEVVPRQLGTALLALDETERQAAQTVVAGLDAGRWRVDQAARIVLVLATFDGDADAFARSVASLVQFGDADTQVALLRGLPLYPTAERLVALASDAAASAGRSVFEAVAHNNPYPGAHFSDLKWNEMVLRAVSLDSRLAPIQGLDERRNAELAGMLMDHARAEWTARRRISPELWRCVGPFASGGYFADLVKAFRSGGGDERRAAALALAECPTPEALIVLETAPTLWRDIRSGRLTWDEIG